MVNSQAEADANADADADLWLNYIKFKHEARKAPRKAGSESCNDKSKDNDNAISSSSKDCIVKLVVKAVVLLELVVKP